MLIRHVVAALAVWAGAGLVGAEEEAPRYRGRFTPDADYVLSGQLHRDLPPLPPVPYDLEGPGFAEERLSRVPPSGVHPRVVLSPEDLDTIRKTFARGDAARSSRPLNR